MGQRGPKPKPASERRTRRVAVYFTPAEYQRLVRAAGADTAPALGRVLRDGALGGRAVPQPAQVPEVNREAWEQLARSLGNLNQLARWVNSGGRVCDDLADELAEMREQVQQLRKELRGEG